METSSREKLVSRHIEIELGFPDLPGLPESFIVKWPAVPRQGDQIIWEYGNDKPPEVERGDIVLEVKLVQWATGPRPNDLLVVVRLVEASEKQ